jgi:HEAT repeats
MDHFQLELFADRPLPARASYSGPTRRIVAEDLSDAALIAALPDALLADASALAAEAGRRRLGEAAPALVALCHRFVGFGVDRVVPEQVAALEALGAIGGPEASRSVGQMIVKRIVQGPNLAAAVIAASRLGVIFPPDSALLLLRHEDPSVRMAACSCVRAGGDVIATLIELLADLDGEVATAAACALGRLGRVEARHRLKHCLTERPSPRVIESVTRIADEEAVVLLARIGRKRPELVNSILSALDEIDLARAAAGVSRELKFGRPKIGKPSSNSGRGGGSPRPERFFAEDPERAAGCEMALDVECVVDGGVNGQEELG